MRLFLLPALVLFSSCGGGDGLFGRCPVSDAHVLVYKLDQGDDGKLDYSETYTYDDDGNLSAMETRGGGHALYAYTYDADGNMLALTVDRAVDGTIDETATFTYDVAGNKSSGTTDWEADGAWDFKAVYEYNDDNLLIRETGSTPALSVVYRDTYSYDRHGNVQSLCANGGSCVTYTYTYDEDLNVVESCDSYDVCVQYSYDRHGGLLTSSTGNGTYTDLATYDGCDHLLSTAYEASSDWDSDGVNDYESSATAQYTYDSEGNVETASGESYESYDYGGDFDGDGIEDGQETSTTWADRYYYSYE